MKISRIKVLSSFEGHDHLCLGYGMVETMTMGSLNEPFDEIFDLAFIAFDLRCGVEETNKAKLRKRAMHNIIADTDDMRSCVKASMLQGHYNPTFRGSVTNKPNKQIRRYKAKISLHDMRTIVEICSPYDCASETWIIED